MHHESREGIDGWNIAKLRTDLSWLSNSITGCWQIVVEGRFEGKFFLQVHLVLILERVDSSFFLFILIDQSIYNIGYLVLVTDYFLGSCINLRLERILYLLPLCDHLFVPFLLLDHLLKPLVERVQIVFLLIEDFPFVGVVASAFVLFHLFSLSISYLLLFTHSLGFSFISLLVQLIIDVLFIDLALICLKFSNLRRKGELFQFDFLLS